VPLSSLFRYGLLSAVLVACTAEALAFRLSPMRYVLEPSGPGAEITLKLENTYPVDLPVEVEVFKRTIAEDGTEIREPADDDFIVFPPQSLIPVGAEQAFRVRYYGPPALDAMESYIVMFRQLPIRNRPEGTSGIDMMLSLGTAAYVGPPGAQADLSLSVESDPAAPGTARVWVQNSGNAFGYIDRFDVAIVSEDGAREVIPSAKISEGLETPLIGPRSRRWVSVEVPESLEGRKLSGAEIVPVTQP